jgi:hypothetical protein
MSLCRGERGFKTAASAIATVSHVFEPLVVVSKTSFTWPGKQSSVRLREHRELTCKVVDLLVASLRVNRECIAYGVARRFTSQTAFLS